MPLTIELAPDREQVLRQEAAHRGMSPSEYAGWLLNGCLPSPSVEDSLTPEEAERMLDELAEQTPDMPVLPRELIDSRAFYYEDHD